MDCILDKNVGFSCLAHAAGSYGSLYRTKDGGISWEEIDYPSAKAKLPDGSYYNPFVMPEKVYDENGLLFMEVGQGADGDYYDSELGFCHGVYQSETNGASWEYINSISVPREYNAVIYADVEQNQVSYPHFCLKLA